MAKQYNKPWKDHPQWYEKSPKLLSKLGLSFKNMDLLFEALTHRSAVSQGEQGDDHHMPWNERLEFLGDSVLNFVITQNIYKKFPDLPEGELSRMRAGLVSEKSLFEIAKQIDLPEFIVVGKSELAMRGQDRPGLHADTLEALFGAIFLDSDLSTVSKVIVNLFTQSLETVGLSGEWKGDYKTEFQERIQEKLTVTPTYLVVEETGPAHQRHFVVAAVVEGKEWARGSGENKKTASQEAAKNALEILLKNNGVKK